jgi:hypothetical protein
MLKDIRFHIEQDEEKQAALEQNLAKHITFTQKDNINAFQRQIPSLLPYVTESRSQNISILCNKSSQFNIVDYGQGRVLYGFDPEAEVRAQVDVFIAHSNYIDFTLPELEPSKTVKEADLQLSSLPAFQRLQKRKVFPDIADLVVVLGIGLGQHIKMLLESAQIKHMIIYEPELQYFSCSVMVTQWREILDIAKNNGTAIYFQMEKDGRDLIEDIAELREHFYVPGFYLYQHYHNPIFNSLSRELTEHSWGDLIEKGISFSLQEVNDDYCPIWSPPIELEEYQSVNRDSQLFQSNLKAFEKYFPDIYKEFKDYSAKKWLPILTPEGQVSILKTDSLVSWYGDQPVDDCIENFNNYTKQPNKDGLQLGYNGTKLKNYIHYQFVKETEEILESLEEEDGGLPQTIKSLIMFGMGVGYQLEELITKHKVEKLFLCEPNRDFFFASLFAIDWSLILRTVDEQQGRIYINIGDDGSNLFRDLLSQFYAIGPYILSHTYFYQSYHNSSLNHAIAQLREQLQVVISMGEYFDHARYGIAHSKESLLREYPHMVNEPAKRLSYTDKQVPVFFIGNGPSLDRSMDSIREWQGKAILVSCGTSLQVLRKNGIRPDFHAEIEQNRTTFDWAARVKDFEFLKSVSLISCNGIHPDTCDLYKDVWVAFKEGESSTVSTLKVLGEQKYETLKFAFPTVTNFALNFFIKLGFNQLYLLGVDLGFTNVDDHHSKQSGYYDENGKPLYDYAEKNNTSLETPGNFRTTVFTKQEFKIARMVMEQSLASSKVDCYNTSDGAKIAGSMPLPLDDILLLLNNSDKQTCMANMRNNCFTVKPKNDFIREYKKVFSAETLNKELSMFRERLAEPTENFEQAERLIETQKTMLFASYQHSDSLLFYFLYGTVNYANVVLNKVAYSSSEGKFSSSNFNQARELWLKYYDKISFACQQDAVFDTSNSLVAQRMISFIKKPLSEKRILVLSESKRINDLMNSSADIWRCKFDFTFVTHGSFIESNEKYRSQFDFIIYYADSDFDARFEPFEKLFLEKFADTQVLCVTKSEISKERIAVAPINICFLYTPGNFMDINTPTQCNVVTRVRLSLLYLLDVNDFVLLIPKYTFSESGNIDAFINLNEYKDMNFYDLNLLQGSPKNTQDFQHRLLHNGTRLSYSGKGLSQRTLNLSQVSDQVVTKKKNKLLEAYPYLRENEYV